MKHYKLLKNTILPLLLLLFLIPEQKGFAADISNQIIAVIKEGITYEQVEQSISHISKDAVIEDYTGTYYLISLENVLDPSTFIKKLKAHNYISLVQPNHTLYSTAGPNDTYYNAQWPLDNNGSFTHYTKGGSYKQTSTPDIDMDIPEAWDYYNKVIKDQQEVIVAIIDTGVDCYHQDLAPMMWQNFDEILGDGLDNDGNGYVDDYFGWDFYNNDNTTIHYSTNAAKQNKANEKDRDDHGTHVAGIIGALSDNKVGIAGIASKANIRLMSLKVLGGNADNSKGSGNTFSAIKAIQYATAMGAKICNLSWGTSQYDEALEQVIRESNMLFIAAAGNSGTDNNINPVYPASYQLDNLISVGSIDYNGSIAPTSNYGVDVVDIAAPGVDIVSTIVGGYANMTGSSMATPHVTAVAAMLYTAYEGLYPSNVKDVILSTRKEIKGLAKYVTYPGIPSALNALQTLDSLDIDKETPIMENFKTSYKKTDILVSFDAYDQGDSDVRVIKVLYGKKKTSDFKNGTLGASVLDQQAKLTKAGTYTFYISDYAGNEAVFAYTAKPDTIAPTIKATYEVSKDFKTKTVTIKPSDKGSGIKTVKYLKGTKKVSDFMATSSGTVLKLSKGTAKFKTSSSGIYTIYTVDYAGNKTVKTINIKVIKSTKITLDTTFKTLALGKTLQLKPILTPINSTDAISYKSSYTKVATVSSKGKITALKVGKTKITAITASGKNVSCIITVIE